MLIISEEKYAWFISVVLSDQALKVSVSIEGPCTDLRFFSHRNLKP